MSPLSTGAEVVAEHAAVPEAEADLEISEWLVAPSLPPAVDVVTEAVDDAAEAGRRLRWWWKRFRRTDGPILPCTCTFEEDGPAPVVDIGTEVDAVDAAVCVVAAVDTVDVLLAEGARVRWRDREVIISCCYHLTG